MWVCSLERGDSASCGPLTGLEWAGLDTSFVPQAACIVMSSFDSSIELSTRGRREVAQHSRKEGIGKELKGEGSQPHGGASAGQGQEGMPRKCTGRFYHMLLHDSMVLTSTEPQVCHCPNLRPSLGIGTQEAVLPVLALVTPVAWQVILRVVRTWEIILDMEFSVMCSKI